MSLYQCEHCGCCENTALGMQPRTPAKWFDWTGIEDREGKHLCSACGPTRYSQGTPTEYGKWHGQFDRVFLPMGKFKTNRVGNLEHIETGTEDFRSFALAKETNNG
ncbi:hypothetical protein [Paraburkholderia graminis]|uniref:hypothetical protein n=1 Tax=Paraburkholderia graminis TaxID=60548 RepID=UPI0038B82196